MHRGLEVRPVGDIQSDRLRVGGTDDAAVEPGDVQPAEPRHVAGQVRERAVAVGVGRRHPGVDARHDLEQRAHGIDDLALRRGSVARKIDDARLREFRAIRPLVLEAANPFERQAG